MQMLEQYPWLLAVAIFVARIADVSLGTFRTILVLRGHTWFAAAAGFLEVMIWVIAASQVLTRLDAWYLAVAYAAGYAVGNAVGIWLESKVALGSELVRAISFNPEIELAQRLRKAGYSVTEIPGSGDNGQPVEVLLVVARRRKVHGLLQQIASADPSAVWTVTDVKRQGASPPLGRTPQGDVSPSSKRK